MEPGPALNTNLAGLALRNPVLLSAGAAGVLDEMAAALDLASIGAVVTKSITAQPRDGNPTWRIVESRAGGGMLNAIGLANPGLQAFLAQHAPRAAGLPTTFIASIAGFSIDDYVSVAAPLDEVPAFPAVELNVSCPNVHGGVEFGADPALLADLITQVRRVLPRTRLIVKLAPVTLGTPHGAAALARAAIEPPGSPPAGPNQRPGADALSLCNTVPAMAIDVRTRAPRLSNITGGLSGPAVHPIVVKVIHDCYRAVCRDSNTPIIGIGGVMNWEDAAEFILAGASAVALGTALFADPRSPARVVRGLQAWARDQGAASIADLVGRVRL